MKLGFLDLPLSERRVYFEQAAQQRGVLSVILEKDFWVCWLLGVLFDSEFGKALVFKGGTSLSKVYHAIERFSEDIDLSVSPDTLGLPQVDPATLSRTQADRWMKQAEAACGDFVRQQMQPQLEATIAEALGPRAEAWLEFVIDPQTNSPVLHFYYPCVEPEGIDYLRRSVKLELGSLTDQQPTGRHPIRPWVAEELPNAFDDWQCEVVALELERTFWEKATILHAEYHRPADRPTPSRFSRHYADMASLAIHPMAATALSLQELRERVVMWKSRFFGSGWARYDLARPGTFRLAPTSERTADLEQDYYAMRDMYLSPPQEFDVVISQLTDLEVRINRGVG